jgi:uncharacterized protein (DUF983 family)
MSTDRARGQAVQWRHLLRMRCPYCGETPLMAHWFQFQHGCQCCDYRYEREIGYFTGASWMVMFPIVALVGFAMAAALLIFVPHLDALVVAAICSVAMVGVGVLIMPLSMALWLYGDHAIHPLNPDDRYDKELVN